MIAVLLLLELAIVGAVVIGRSDQDLLVRRMESCRALYAAEAVASMALRELETDTDEDGDGGIDGGIGTISHDGDPGTDPRIGPATAYATTEVVGPDLLLTCFGTSGEATRSLEVTLPMGP